MTDFIPEDYRAALGQFATGVTIVTAIDEKGERIGLTANSFNSVSLSPPLVLWSLSRQSKSLTGLKTASAYAINVLAGDQRVLAERFAKRGIDRFEGVSWQKGLSGAPLIDGAAASFECRQYNHHEEGDHLIFVGEVIYFKRRVGTVPLLFHGGRFFSNLPL